MIFKLDMLKVKYF